MPTTNTRKSGLEPLIVKWLVEYNSYRGCNYRQVDVRVVPKYEAVEYVAGDEEAEIE